jgi:hypothetical protein
MPGKTPHSNGNEPVENGIRSNQDVDMKEKGKAKKTAKEGDEEMTVVVPPTRPIKSSAPPLDSDDDVAMDLDGDKAGVAEVKVDPVLQTTTGKLQPCRHLGRPVIALVLQAGSNARAQTSKTTSPSSTAPSPSSMPDSRSERSDPCR